MKKVREGYKMTELGEIPNSWKVEKIGNIFDFYGGISISRDKQSDNGVYYLHYGDIHKKNKNYFSVEEDCDWLPKIEISVNNLNEGILLNTGDVVFADASEDYEGIGKSVVIINENNEHFVSGLHTIVAKDKVDEINTLYKKYCFNTTEVRKQFRILATGATVYGISRSNIKDIKILVPTIKEQEQIALTLSSIDEQIEINDNLIEKTNKLKKGLMKKLLTKGIGHSKFKDTEIGKIPEEWEVKSIEDVCTIVDYRGKTPTKVEEGVFLVTAKNIGKGFIDYNVSKEYIKKQDYDNVMSRGLPKKGDVLFTTEAPLGNVANVDREDIALAQRVIKLRGILEILNNYYLKYYMLSENFQKAIYDEATGSTVLGIKGSRLKKIKLLIPTLKEQLQISSILSSVDEQIQQYQSKKEKLQELKKGLMQKLLTGKIRVR